MNKNIFASTHPDIQTEEIISSKQPTEYTCPRCQDQKLNLTAGKNSKYFQCEQCGGVWFEINELEKTIDANVKFKLPKMLHPQTLNQSKRTFCPSCVTKMSLIKSLEIQNMEIATCMICQGRWLDGVQIAELQNRGLLNQLKGLIMRLF